MDLKYLEVISGLGMGGAEKAFLNRLNFPPPGIQTVVLNTRSELDFWTLPPEIEEFPCSRKSVSFFRKAASVVSEVKPSAIITRTPIDLLLIAFLNFVFRKNWQIVYEAHSIRISHNKVLSRILTPILKRILPRINLVLAASKMVEIEMQRIGAKNTLVHYFGAEVAQPGDSRNGIQILFIGRFINIKRPILLLEAIRDLRGEFLESGAQILFVGRGPLESEMREFIESNELGNFVKIIGSQQSLKSYYESSEFLISTSLYEGLPISFFEAKLYGLRIITTPSSGDFDILGPEDLITKDFSLQEIKCAIELSLQSKTLTAKSRISIQEANQWMNARFTSEKYYRAIELVRKDN